MHYNTAADNIAASDVDYDIMVTTMVVMVMRQR